MIFKKKQSTVRSSNTAPASLDTAQLEMGAQTASSANEQVRQESLEERAKESFADMIPAAESAAIMWHTPRDVVNAL